MSVVEEAAATDLIEDLVVGIVHNIVSADGRKAVSLRIKYTTFKLQQLQLEW